MKMPALPYQIIDKLSECIALLDRKGRLVYGNREFEDLFYIPGVSLEKGIPPQLKSIFKSFSKSKEMYLSDWILIPHLGKEFEVFLYSLDNCLKDQGFTLVMVIKEHPIKIIERFMGEELMSTSINLHNVLSEKLDPEFAELRGEDISFKAALIKAQRAARTDLPVLIRGESGTGKEILARIIHRISARKEEAFVDINCSAIPDSLIESELFGYEKGAFTGALREGKRGLLEEANKGTIFLDEIGDASLSVQSKLLRVLQEGRFKKIGGTKNVTVDVRIISATNKDLESLVKEKLFRDDLYYRLNTFSITLPPLRNRGKDMRLLAKYFLQKGTPDQSKSLSLSEEALKLMESYSWPGNIRELKAVVDYAIIMSNDQVIGIESLPPFLFSSKSQDRKEEILDNLEFSYSAIDRILPTVVQKVEKMAIEMAVKNARNMSEAIKMLGISRRSFYTKLKKYRIR